MFRTIVDIDGMMCGMCESHVNDAVRNNFKVKKVSSSHGKGRTVIESEAPLDEGDLRRVIGATGYEVQQVTSEEVQRRAFLADCLGSSSSKHGGPLLLQRRPRFGGEAG